MPVVIVSGAVANKPRNGGEAWVRLSWALGLRRLGFDVYFVEQISPATCFDEVGAPAGFESCANRDYFWSVMRRFGLAEKSALVCAAGEDVQCDGLTWDRLLDVAAAAEMLVNISGHLTLAPVTGRIRRKAYVDIDPGFTQFWHADPATKFRVEGHDLYFTIGENINSPRCAIPTAGIDWRPVRQPVVLDDWPVTETDQRGRFTTVASWRAPFGPVQFGGRTYGLKLHEFRKFLALPRLAAQKSDGVAPVFELALDIHPGDARDRAALEEHGWRLTDPKAAAGDPDVFRRFVQASGAEFSVAQGVYVDTNSGWFSDRTARYLASGKPALVQETGFSLHLPSGEGLVPFRTPEEAADGARRILANYAEHCHAARRLAESHFGSDEVLARFVNDAGLA